MSVTSEQDKPIDDGRGNDPEKDLRAMHAEFEEAGIEPPGGPPTDADDNSDGDDSGGEVVSCEKELSNALSHAKSLYALETKRLELLCGFYDEMSPAVCKFIPADSEEIKQNWLTDDIAFAHEQAVIAVFRAIKRIAKRSDAVLFASHVFALGHAAKVDRKSGEPTR